MINILTIDLEDWYHGTQADNTANWTRDSARGCVESATLRLLELLREHTATATFFVLGPVAQQHPALIRAIADAGHELASHGWSHRRLWLLTPGEFRDELERTDAAIGAALGRSHRSRGFRAPYFTMSSNTAWAVPVLREHGMTYDSSTFPIRNYLGGAPGRPRFAHDWQGIREIPVSTLRVLGVNLPFSGGFYLRLWPAALVTHGIRTLNHAGQPAVVYLHPREIAPDQPRAAMPWWQAATYYYNLAGTEEKFTRLLREFRFASIAEVQP